MHIAMVSNLFPPEVHGGYELLARDAASALEARGHRVSVLTTGARAECDGPSVHRVLRLSRTFGEPAGRDRVRQALAAAANDRAARAWVARHGRPDATLVMSLRRLGPSPVRALGAPSVLTVNDEWPVAFARETRSTHSLRSRVGAWLDATPLGRPSLEGLRPYEVVYLSEAVRSYVRTRNGAVPQGRVCPQGVDLRAFTPREFRAADAPVRLLSVGRLHPDKAPDVAIDAVAALVARGIDTALDLAGLSHDAQYERALRSRANELGVQRRVRFLGPVARADLPALYRASDAFLFLSRVASEGLGLTWIEAMASGVPVVAWASGGAREALGAGDLCVLGEACTGEALARGVEELVRDPARQERLVRAGLHAVRERYSLERYIGVLEGALRDAATHSGA